MAKILFYTDTHFGNTGDFSHPSASGYSTRLDYTIALHQWILDLVEEHQPDLIVNGGDLYKSQGTIEAKAISACTATMTNIARKCPSIPHFVLLGNHDFITTDRSISSIDWLEKLPPFTLVKETTVVEDFGFSMVLAPYFHTEQESYESVQEALAQCTHQTKVFFGHLNLRGVIESVTRTPAGFSEYKLEGSDNKKFVDCKLLSSSFTFAFNGHHHVPQQPFTNVILPGSLQQFTVTEFDYGMRRGVWIIDTDKQTTKLIPNYISPRITKVFKLSQLDELEDNTNVIYTHIDSTEQKPIIEKALERFQSSRILSTAGLVTKDKDDSTPQLNLESSSPEETFEKYVDSLFKDSPEIKQLGLSFITKAKAAL